jgi:hypothetical protein
VCVICNIDNCIIIFIICDLSECVIVCANCIINSCVAVSIVCNIVCIIYKIIFIIYTISDRTIIWIYIIPNIDDISSCVLYLMQKFNFLLLLMKTTDTTVPPFVLLSFALAVKYSLLGLNSRLILQTFFRV